MVLSRTHKTLVARLFEMEVPEIYDGLVLLKAIERDPGDRAKVAVTATVDDIDAVGHLRRRQGFPRANGCPRIGWRENRSP